MKKILLSAAFAVPFLMNAQTTLVSEDFDGYAAGDLLTDVGAANGWREWGVPNGDATAGYSAQVTDLAASSGALAGRSFSDADAGIDTDAIWSWTDLTSGKYSITMNLYVPAGSAGGYIGVGDSDMDGSGSQSNALYIMGDSLLLMSDDAAYFGQAPLTPDTWFAVEMVIDLDAATAELFVDGMSYGAGNATFTADGIGLGGLDLWGTSVDVTQQGVYNPGDYYYDDIAVSDVTGGAGVEENNPMAIGVSPNPSNGTFSIDFNDYAFDNASLTITNMLGAVVYTETLSAVSNATKNFNLDINSGVYVVKVADNANEFSSRIVIK
ncbi:T9SS type A sorting domain-containing protein [bacterium]|nr:T9SS type A sorting domain-containing protein [bacterium]